MIIGGDELGCNAIWLPVGMKEAKGSLVGGGGHEWLLDSVSCMIAWQVGPFNEGSGAGSQAGANLRFASVSFDARMRY